MLYDEFAKNYPPEYMVGFYVRDEEAINAYLTYLAIRGAQLEGVVVEETPHGTVVYARIDDALEEINWAEPNTMPEGLPGYANTVWQFAGPDEVQKRRAALLAERAVEDKDVRNLDEVKRTFIMMQLMGRGIILLEPRP